MRNDTDPGPRCLISVIPGIRFPGAGLGPNESTQRGAMGTIACIPVPVCPVRQSQDGFVTPVDEIGFVVLDLMEAQCETIVDGQIEVGVP